MYDMGILLARLERAAHLIGIHAERTSRDLGITQAEVHVLLQLARNGAMPIAALHREFGTKRSTLTNVLDRLEARGFIRRELNPSDRRSFTIQLTRAGAVHARRLSGAMDDLEALVRHAVSERDVRGVEAVVEALAAAVHRG
jgi:MarR family 2-MHQ and catechol resistance regulon transcriptional repressor